MGTVMDEMLDWLYRTIIGAFVSLFSLFNNMATDIFDFDWVKSTLMFFSYFAWGLFVVGLVVAIFEAAIEYQSGKGSIKDTFLNALKGFFAVGVFTTVPVELYKLSVTLSDSLIQGVIEYGGWQNAATIILEKMSQGPEAQFNDVLGRMETVTMTPLLLLVLLIMMIYSICKCFFGSLKRGGILITQICVGSLYMFSVPRGYLDGFTQWCKQVAALCFTTFMQTLLLSAGLFMLKQDIILGIGIMLAAGEVPRIATMFGLDTSTKANLSGAVHTAQSAVHTAQSVKQLVKGASAVIK